MNTHALERLKTDDFDYQLPSELIAKYPLKERTSSRLLVVDRVARTIAHYQFKDILNFLKPEDVMVFNNTKVIPARLYGEKQSGGKIECLIERVLDSRRALAHIKASKSPKQGSKIWIAASTLSPRNDGLAGSSLRGDETVEVIYSGIILSRQDSLFEIEFETEIETILENAGKIPLPHYMGRDAELSDLNRYQTVYAKEKGAVAAPTAGLHFDEAILNQIQQKRVSKVEVTLHVGAGTFQPVRVDDVTQHQMHSEWMSLSKMAADKINLAKRVIAVGTTSVRCLETASGEGKTTAYIGDTNIFIYPGFQFQRVNGLLTNFHLPKSTLMMLVCAFGGYELIMQAYREAVKEKYRFYSYGDAMLII